MGGVDLLSMKKSMINSNGLKLSKKKFKMNIRGKKMEILLTISGQIVVLNQQWSRRWLLLSVLATLICYIVFKAIKGSVDLFLLFPSKFAVVPSWAWGWTMIENAEGTDVLSHK